MASKRNIGKEIKDIGVLCIVLGIISLILVFYTLFSSANPNENGLLYLTNEHFVFLVIFGLVSLLVGIITRSIGKSKEAKFLENNKD